MSIAITTIDLWKSGEHYYVTEPQTPDQQEVAVEVEVDFDYQPEEKQTRTYPGCDALISLNSVIEVVAKGREGEDLSFVLDDESIKDQIEEACLDEIRTDEDRDAIDRWEAAREN